MKKRWLAIAAVVTILGISLDITTQTSVNPSTVSGDASSESIKPIVGEELIGEMGKWSKKEYTFSYQWQKCNEKGQISSCTNIPGATTLELDITSEYKNHTVRLAVKGKTGGKEKTRYSSVTEDITNEVGEEVDNGNCTIENEGTEELDDHNLQPRIRLELCEQYVAEVQKHETGLFNQYGPKAATGECREATHCYKQDYYVELYGPNAPNPEARIDPEGIAERYAKCPCQHVVVGTVKTNAEFEARIATIEKDQNEEKTVIIEPGSNATEMQKRFTMTTFLLVDRNQPKFGCVGPKDYCENPSYIGGLTEAEILKYEPEDNTSEGTPQGIRKEKGIWARGGYITFVAVLALPETPKTMINLPIAMCEKTTNNSCSNSTLIHTLKIKGGEAWTLFCLPAATATKAFGVDCPQESYYGIHLGVQTGGNGQPENLYAYG